MKQPRTVVAPQTIQKPNYRKRIAVAGILLMLAGIGIVVSLDKENAAHTAYKSVSGEPWSIVSASSAVGMKAAPTITMSSLSPEEKQLGISLQQRYGSKLAQPFWRLQVIQTLKRYLMEKYPYDWLSRLKAMLKLLFPADYDKLLASLEAIESYNAWMSENKNSRVFNSKEERLRATWDKRLQLFGEDAKVIWQAQLQQEKVDAVLQQLDSPSLPLAAKIDRYVQTLVDVYGKSAIDPDKSHPVQQMEGLLTLNSVQEQLHSLPPERRKEELHHLRSAMGLDTEAVKRWDELDAERAQRATAGVSYMQERTALAKQYEGDALQLQIQALQNRKFGAEEAQYIRNEEETDFYRYQERQQIGIN
ncbi:MAG: hypothetical protein Q7U16_00155 [Agitococcus sp.]|nr:hypothetical protein [Agitococcus sp.]